MNKFHFLTRSLILYCVCASLLIACVSAPPATPTVIPATATLAPTPTSEPVTNANYAGLYRGITSQGRTFELLIEDGGVRSVLLDFEIPGCETKQYSPLTSYYGQVQGSIENGTLSLKADSGLVITGTFVSATEMAGTLEIKTFLCERSATASWQASTNFVPMVPTPSPELLQLLPDTKIPAGLFWPEVGSNNIDQMEEILVTQGDWILVRNFRSIFPIPKGWATVETGQETLIAFSTDGNLDNPSILIRLGGIGYIGDNRTSEDVMAELEKDLKEIPSAFLLDKKIVDESKGYYFLTLTTNTGRKRNLMVLFSEDVQGFFHLFVMQTAPEDWEVFYPLAREMVGHWADLEFKPLGMPLPNEVSTENAQALFVPPAYPPGTWELVPEVQLEFLSFNPRALAVDQQNQIWVGTGNAGLFKLDTNDQWTNYTPENSGLDGSGIWSLVVDAQNQIWAETNVLAANGNWMSYTAEFADLTSYGISAMAIDMQGRAWFGNPDGLFVRLPNGKWEHYTTEKSGLVSDRIEAITIDDAGRVWAGGWAGLNMLSPDGKLTTYKPDAQWGEHEEVSALAIDGLGQVWVGTNDGLRRLDAQGKWTALILSEEVTALVVDENDTLWIGTPSGLYSLDATGKQMAYTFENSGIAPGEVEALSLDRQGGIWVATTLLSMMDTQGQWTSYRPEIPKDPKYYDDWSDNFIHDQQGRLWVGTPDGLYVQQLDGQWSVYTSENSQLFSNNIEGLAIDSQGHIWVGDFSGGVVSIGADGVWETYSAEELELGDEFIYTLAIDKQDRIWVGTSGDLKMYDPDTGWRSYEPKGLGFDNVNVQGLAVDQDNQIWVRLWVVDNSEYQVATFNPSE